MATKPKLPDRIGEDMAEVDPKKIAADVVEQLRPILVEQGAKVATHVENSTSERIDQAVAKQLPAVVHKVIKATFDVNADNDEEVRRVKKNLEFLSSLKNTTDKVGGHVIRALLLGLVGLASYGAYLTGWKK